MIVINLRIYYPVLYRQDVFCEVPEQVKLLLEELKRLEHAQDERRRYHGECLAFIEAVTDLEMELPSLEEIYMKTQRNEALYKAMLKMRRIYAHFFLRLSETEIARAERVSIAAVSASIAQGLRHLRQYLSKE